MDIFIAMIMMFCSMIDATFYMKRCTTDTPLKYKIGAVFMTFIPPFSVLKALVITVNYICWRKDGSS